MASWVWNHFTKIPDRGKVKCDHCSKQFSSGGSTSSKAEHLKKEHGLKPGSKIASKSNSLPPVVTISDHETINETSNEPLEPTNVEEPKAKKIKLSAENAEVLDLVTKKSVQPSAKTSFKPPIEERMAKMAAVDGFSCNAIAKSEFIQEGKVFLLSLI